MSVRIMAAVFESSTLKAGERLVMLALADHADDQGRCYPSTPRLAQRTGMSERAVQGHIKALRAEGYLQIEDNAGPGGTNLFFVRPTPVTPADSAPPQKLRPRKSCATPPQKTSFTPAESADEPSRTTIEPSIPEANASGRCAPSEAENAEFWANAREYLKRKRVSEKPAGSFIGKMIREHGFNRTREAFRRSQREGVAEPIPWITATLKTPAHQPAITAETLRLVTAQMEADEAFEQRRAAR